MPVHGEWRHLRARADLAVTVGVGPTVVIAEDGVVVDLVDGVASIVGSCRGYVYVDGLSVGDISESLLTDRRILGDEGFISVFVVVDSLTGKLVGGPSSARICIEDAAFDEVAERIDQAITGHGVRGLARPARDPAAGPAHRGPLGQRPLPPPADDRPGRRRGLISARPCR